MNILYVSQYFPPEACAPAARVDDFAREWVRAGHSVRVLTGFPNHPEGVLHPEYRRRWRTGLAREERAGVSVYRTWLYPAANRGLWGRAANYCSFALSAAVVGPWIAPADGVVIGTSPQLLVGVAGYLIAQPRRGPFVFEVRDLWPQSLEAVGQTSRHSLLYRSVGCLANFLYRQADRIVVDGELKRRTLAAAGVPPEKIAVIRNGVAEDFCLPDQSAAREVRERTRKEWGFGDRFVVLYAGTLGMAHGLETVLLAADRLRERRDIVFFLVGEGAERERLIRRGRELSLTNLRYPGKQPREKIPALLEASDACLVPLRRSHVFQTAIPSKMFEAMAAGKPVILGVEGEAKEMLLNAKAGITVPPEDPAALAEAILRLRLDQGLSRELGANGRRAVREKYSRRQLAASYLELLAGLVAEARHSSPVRWRAPKLAGAGRSGALSGRKL